MAFWPYDFSNHLIVVSLVNKGKYRNSDHVGPDFKSVQAASDFHPWVYLLWVDASENKHFFGVSWCPKCKQPHDFSIFILERKKFD